MLSSTSAYEILVAPKIPPSSTFLLGKVNVSAVLSADLMFGSSVVQVSLNLISFSLCFPLRLTNCGISVSEL